jgi:hypothetical protein
MTYYREVQYHEIPERYAAQTLAMAEAHYGSQAEFDAAADEEWAEAEGMSLLDLDRNLYPDDFVSEDDYNAATPAEWDGLQTVLDWEQHSHTL